MRVYEQDTMKGLMVPPLMPAERKTNTSVKKCANARKYDHMAIL